jgi:hypothetical protein
MRADADLVSDEPMLSGRYAPLTTEKILAARDLVESMKIPELSKL